MILCSVASSDGRASCLPLEQVQRLRTAIDEYETDKWRIIAGKVGNGFSAGACKEKALELDSEEVESRTRAETEQDLTISQTIQESPTARLDFSQKPKSS